MLQNCDALEGYYCHKVFSDKIKSILGSQTSLIVDSKDDISADRLKNAAATKKLAIFDAFEILTRIQEEENMLDDTKKDKKEEKQASFKGFAEGRSR